MVSAIYLSIGRLALATEYQLDPAPSKLQFQAESRFGKANGKFHDFNVNADINENAVEKSSFTVTINIDSIDTGIKARDKHLRTPAFFDAAKYPTATFKSVSIETTTIESSYLVHGELTMHGVTRPVDIPMKVALVLPLDGAVQMESSRCLAEGETTIDRKEFDINYDSKLNPIKDSVKIIFDVSLQTIPPLTLKPE